MFVDEAAIIVKAGSGGDGKISFKRDYGQRYSGPDGGNGGSGGDVYLRADKSVNTLLKFERKNKFVADSGDGGGAQNKTGKSAENLSVDVPVGTVVYDGKTDEKLVDLTAEGQTYLVVQGGRGGRGNEAFASSWLSAPRLRELGGKGQEKYLKLELKLLADVGIIGFPNVGKSSLISKISAQKPKIANYHFTTMDPHPGVVDVGDWKSFVAVDIPGLIEGAHEGKGLGDDFLRHLGRTKLLLHMVDISGLERRDPLEDWKTLREELRKYDGDLETMPELVVGNKIDLMDEDEVDKQCKRFSNEGVALTPISVATGQGISGLVSTTYDRLQEYNESKESEEAEEADADATFRLYEFEGERGFRVVKQGERYVVEGQEVEQLAEMLDFSTRDAPEYFQEKLEEKGIIKKLKSSGASDGSIVQIGGREFELVI